MYKSCLFVGGPFHGTVATISEGQRTYKYDADDGVRFYKIMKYVYENELIDVAVQGEPPSEEEVASIIRNARLNGSH